MKDVDPAAAIDARNPWLGLASFTEETREYFHGRDEEIAELARRVQRKLLTVLFGQSGLGKTSILRAGLVPRLRGQGYCPVYVRIDYGQDAPEPAAQIKRAIAQTARRSGEWTQEGVAVTGESLWEFLHHRDDVLQDEAGKTLIPLLIFDQFEEIFTLAQSDEQGRARAARFVTDLADLVENRPPQELEARLDSDDTAAERFDFSRSDYRVLIALREDYLAPLESLKPTMPSITQNRLRLAPMTGTQALAAVLRPGKGLVTEEVAAAIVRFVAGGAELVNAEVEPSLLSLICRELNDTRLAEGRREISLDLLDGSQSSILENFYERSLADQPAAVRRIIEDELLTDSGFRENIAEERLLASFKAAGVPPDTLAVLVNRRLLRIEERLDIRRVELTHDVLCGVVKASRDLRKAREETEATERLLAEQNRRELAARRALVRARQVAAACAALTLLAIAAAGFAVWSTQRAKRAEALAQTTRSAADTARTQAEHLLGYLTDDFARELETYGRLDAVASIAKREIDYFHALPPALQSPEATRNGALALVDYASANQTLGDTLTGNKAADEAVRLLKSLQQAGDQTEATALALARALRTLSVTQNSQSRTTAYTTAQEAVAVAKPFATAARASAAARRVYAETLLTLGDYQHFRFEQHVEALATLQAALHLDNDLGAHELSDLQVTANYVDTAGWTIETLDFMGRLDEARALGLDATALAQKLLDQRPSYRKALHGAQLVENFLGETEMTAMNPAAALGHFRRGRDFSLETIKLDPSNTIAYNNLSATEDNMAGADWNSGHVRDSFADGIRAHQAASRADRAGSWFVQNSLIPLAMRARQQADFGDFNGAQATTAEAKAGVDKLAHDEATENKILSLSKCLLELTRAGVSLARSDLHGTVAAAKAAENMADDVDPDAQFQGYERILCTAVSRFDEAEADVELGNLPEAESAQRKAMAIVEKLPIESDDDRRHRMEASVHLAWILAGEHRTADAAKVLEPAVRFDRELAARNHGDATQTGELAVAIYVNALTDPKRRATLLREAATLIDGMPAELRALHSMQRWRQRIRAAASDAGSTALP
jgi:tetratricopeptide (TPR) repeat protein